MKVLIKYDRIKANGIKNNTIGGFYANKLLCI